MLLFVGDDDDNDDESLLFCSGCGCCLIDVDKEDSVDDVDDIDGEDDIDEDKNKACWFFCVWMLLLILLLLIIWSLTFTFESQFIGIVNDWWYLLPSTEKSTRNILFLISFLIAANLDDADDDDVDGDDEDDFSLFSNEIDL